MGFFIRLPTRFQPDAATVDLSHCDTKLTHLTLTDDNFNVSRRGEIVAAKPVAVPSAGRTFSVWAEDGAGWRAVMEVRLDCASQVSGPRPDTHGDERGTVDGLEMLSDLCCCLFFTRRAK